MVGKRRSVRETGLGFKIDMDVQNLHVGSDRWSKDSKGHKHVQHNDDDTMHAHEHAISFVIFLAPR